MDLNGLPYSYRSVLTKVAALSVALEERDGATQNHCERVSGLCLELGQACGLEQRELVLLRLAAGLHDIGKIGIPDDVLKKPGLFTDRDRAIMQTHSARGERIVMASGMDHAEVLAAVVRHHHERYDGRGYPDGLAGDVIPLLSRMIALVDAYDAMARFRPHANRRTHAAIMRELGNEEGGQHDPLLIRAFSTVIERSRFKAEP